MDGEQNTNTEEGVESSTNGSGTTTLRGVPPDQVSNVIQLMQADLERLRAGIPVQVYASSHTDGALSEEELQNQIDLLHEQLELEKKQQEIDRRAVKLGLLKLADQARRCSVLKSNGKPCRGPALGNSPFCVFHGRAHNGRKGPVIDVNLLENRESLQLTVKQIMEQIVTGYIKPETASLLLRAVQIANSTLKPRRTVVARRKPTRSETGVSDNAEEKAG